VSTREGVDSGNGFVITRHTLAEPLVCLFFSPVLTDKFRFLQGLLSSAWQ
jgi:hypothetical protein